MEIRVNMTAEIRVQRKGKDGKEELRNITANTYAYTYYQPEWSDEEAMEIWKRCGILFPLAGVVRRAVSEELDRGEQGRG